MSEEGATVQDATFHPLPTHSLPTQTIHNAASIIQALDALSQNTQNNPGYLNTLSCLPAITLASPSVSGGKFWKGLATDTGLEIRWGKCGTSGRLLPLPLTQCKQNNPVFELRERLIKKLNKGYSVSPHETHLP